MRKTGKGKEENEEKWGKNEKMKEENEKCKRKGLKIAEDLFFFFAFHFQETTETFFGSTKMEISTGEKAKITPGNNREK